MSRDFFANHVVRRIFEVANELEDSALRTQMLRDGLKGHVLSLATHEHGCRVIQRILETAPVELQVELTEEI
jgi:hypothetical protein